MHSWQGSPPPTPAAAHPPPLAAAHPRSRSPVAGSDVLVAMACILTATVGMSGRQGE